MGNALIKLSGGPAARLNHLVHGSTRLLAAVGESTLAERTAARVAVEHVRVARVELAKALHWHRFFAPTAANDRRVAAHAHLAGVRMSYAGLPYVMLAAAYPEAAAVPVLWDAVRDGWFATEELMSVEVAA